MLKPKTRRYREAYLRLNAAFPLAFPLDDADIRPLALSIRDEVFAWVNRQGFDRWMSRAILGVAQQHCCRKTYQSTVVAGAMRINLQGEPVEPVTPGGQAHAEGRIAAILAARAQAERRPAARPVSAKAASTPAKPKALVRPQAAPPASTPKATPTVIIKKRRAVVLPPKD